MLGAPNGSLASSSINEILMTNKYVTKRLVNKDYAKQFGYEVGWYRFVEQHGYPNIPRIFAYNPLKMERIRGMHPNTMNESSPRKTEIMNNILDAIELLHSIGSAPARIEDMKEVYLYKTIDRMRRIKKSIPAHNASSYTVNGRRVKNLLNPHHTGMMSRLFRCIRVPKRFTVIHGDPTFSNTLIDSALRVFFIDPRGYFGGSRVYGDPLYDYAKLFYSISGSYDEFNERRFKLDIDSSEVGISINKSGWENMAGAYESRIGEGISSIQLLQPLIWLSLAGSGKHAADNEASIRAAFFHGLELFDQAYEQAGLS